MSTSSKRPLIFIILFLLLTNIGVLAYFLRDKKPSKPQAPARNGISYALQNEVGFDEAQIVEYRKLKEEQWAAIRPMFENMRRAKDSLYRLLSNPAASDSLVEATADLVGRQQKEIDLQAFRHFKQVRALCHPDQFEKYDSLVQKIVRKMGKSPKGNEQGKKDKDRK